MVAAVAGAIDLDAVDPNLGISLTVTLELLVLFLALEVEDQNLVSPSIAQDGSQHLALGRLGDGGVPIGKSEHVVELYSGVGFATDLLNLHHIARSDAMLFPACADDSVHKPSTRRTTPAFEKLGWAATGLPKVLKP